MAELTENILITIKDGYSAKDIETVLLSVGARVNSSNGNTVNATVSPLLINHLKANAAVENVSDVSESSPVPSPATTPAPLEETKKRWFNE